MHALTIAKIIEPFYAELVPRVLAYDCAAHVAMSLDSTMRSVEEDGDAVSLLVHGLDRVRRAHVWQRMGIPTAPVFTDAQAAEVARRALDALVAAGYQDVSGDAVRESGKRPRPARR